MTDTPTPSTAAPTTEIVLFDGFDDLDAVAPLEILRAAGFPVRAVGFPAGPVTVTSAHGLRVEVDGISAIAPELVVIPGGGWATAPCRGSGRRPTEPCRARWRGCMPTATVSPRSAPGRW